MRVFEPLLVALWRGYLTLAHTLFGKNARAFRVERRNVARSAAGRIRNREITLRPAIALRDYLRAERRPRADGRKPILFWHIHKGGGSSFIELARRNGEVLHPYSLNGNAHTEGLDPIEAYERAISLGVTFLAVEYDWQFRPELLDHPAFHTVVQLRDPIDVYRSHAVWSGRLPKQNDPMVHLLCPDDPSLEQARERIEKFDTVVFLSECGTPTYAEALRKDLGWTITELPREKVYYERNVSKAPFAEGWNSLEQVTPHVELDLELYRHMRARSSRPTDV